MYEIDIIPMVFSIYDSDYIGGKPTCNPPKNMGSTKGILFMIETRKLVINYIHFRDMATVIGNLLDF